MGSVKPFECCVHFCKNYFCLRLELLDLNWVRNRKQGLEGVACCEAGSDVCLQFSKTTKHFPLPVIPANLLGSFRRERQRDLRFLEVAFLNLLIRNTQQQHT